MSESKTVIILGAGIGGVVAANSLRKFLPRNHKIIVIDREANHFFAPSFLWLMIGDRTSHQISKPLDRLNRKGIDFVRGEIKSIDPKTKSVTVSGKTYKADALIISLGADLAPEKIPGLKEAGQSLYSLSGSEEIYKKLSHFTGGKILILTAAPMYKCPAAPYEAAMLIEGYLQRRGIRQKSKIELYAAEPAPMATAGPDVSAGVRRMVESKSIQYYPSHQVTEVNAQERTVNFSNGASANFDLLFYVPPHIAPKVTGEAGLLSENGWITVDRGTLETPFRNVFAIGDVTLIPLKIGKPLPKAGVFAHAQAEVVANNIALDWTGHGTQHRFDGIGQCFIEVGNGMAGIGKGNFYAEPAPTVAMKNPSVFWHYAKMFFEKYWLWKWF